VRKKNCIVVKNYLCDIKLECFEGNCIFKKVKREKRKKNLHLPNKAIKKSCSFFHTNCQDPRRGICFYISFVESTTVTEMLSFWISVASGNPSRGPLLEYCGF
jgi:hypothetical protein